MSKLRDNFGKKFIVTGEAAPPAGPDIEEFAHEVEIYKTIMDKIEGVNVVDLPGARLLMSSLGASIYMIQRGVEPIFQMVTRDRNILALQADLISASVFGIENVLALTGDHPASSGADHKMSKPVYDLDSTTLIKTIKGMNNGIMFNGKNLNGKTNFFIGASLSPTTTPIEGEIYKTKRKLLAGVDFFQTQALFDIDSVSKFIEKYEKTFGEKIHNKILVGITIIRSYGMMKYLLSLPGIVINENIQNKVKETKKDSKKVEEIGIQICEELIDKIKSIGVKGVHIMPVGNADAVVKLLKNI